MNDAALFADLQAASAGAADALQRLIVHYHATLRGAVAAAVPAKLRTRLEPDDILQQAYIAAFQALGQSPSGSAGHVFNTLAGFYKWLEAIALNQLKDAGRALHRGKRDIGRVVPNVGRGGGAASAASYPDLLARVSAGDSTPSRALRREEASAAVLTCLARLKDDQREVVRLRFLEDVPVAEIAERLGKTETAVYTLCHRGLKALRELLGPITRLLTRS
jgi:RNA polymerase sigma-70 factor, ECF subfamily